MTPRLFATAACADNATMRLSPLLLALVLAGCSVGDSRTALRAQTALLGANEIALETCMGAPDQKNSFGTTDILTYEFTSTSSTSLSIPLIGGIGDSYGGDCRVIVRADAGRVVSIHYVGETNAFIAPDAYCAPIVRTCLKALAS
jgi:hypothetical protein